MKTPAVMTLQGGRWALATWDGRTAHIHQLDDAPTPDGDAAAQDPSRRAADAAELVKRARCSREVHLALPSHMVFSAGVDCHNLPRKQRRTAMLYRLEEHLPLDAEALTAEFLAPVAGRALAVAVRTEQAEQLIAELEQAHLRPGRMYPLALLAVWPHRQAFCKPAIVLVASPGTVDVVRMHQGRPVAWTCAADEPAAVVAAVAAEMLLDADAADPPALAILAADDWHAPDELQSLGLAQVARIDESPLAAAARALPAVAAGGKGPWGNLRRDRLADAGPWRRHPALVATSLAMLLVLAAALAGSMMLRSARYRDAADEARRQQAQVYRQLYPASTPPLSVARSLAAEHERLAGISGAVQAVPYQPCALETLRTIARGLPTTLRFRVLEIQVAPGDVLIEGQARSHADAETVRRGLAAAGLDAAAPQTHRLAASSGVAFTIAARVPPPQADPPKPATGDAR